MKNKTNKNFRKYIKEIVYQLFIIINLFIGNSNRQSLRGFNISNFKAKRFNKSFIFLLKK